MQKSTQGKIIAIVGPHYSGKSTLAKKMAKINDFLLIEENWKDDPFSEFRKKGDYLKSQLWYLTETMKAMLQAQQHKESGKKVILDTFVHTTRAFCRSKLSTQDFKIFNIIFNEITKGFPLPDLIIYLHARPETLLKHSVMRSKSKTGPANDSQTDIEWINKTVQVNETEFGNWDTTPIITIDVSKQDLLNNTVDYKELIKKINTYA